MNIENIEGKEGLSEVRDGIIEPQLFCKAKIRILWILKEVNDDQGGGWDLRKFLGDEKELKKYNRWIFTFGPIIDVSYGILSGFPPYAEAKTKVEDKIPILKQISVINVNKLPGRQWSSYKGLIAAFERFRPRILGQIDEIGPHIIIGGGTIWLFYKTLGITEGDLEKPCSSMHSFVKEGRLWICAYHPGQRKISHEQYYSQIIDRVKRFIEIK
jgi:hypothetical protein